MIANFSAASLGKMNNPGKKVLRSKNRNDVQNIYLVNGDSYELDVQQIKCNLFRIW